MVKPLHISTLRESSGWRPACMVVELKNENRSLCRSSFDAPTIEKRSRLIQHYAFRLPYIFRLSDPCRSGLLAIDSPQTECFFAARELFLLRVVGLAISGTDGWQHDDGLPDRAKDSCCA